MRRMKATVFVALAIAVGWYVTTPDWAVGGLAEALESGDSVEIEERVDMDRLKDGLKAQVQGVVADETGGGTDSDDPLVALGTGLAMVLADGLIDVFLTPSALASMSRGMGPRGSGSDAEPFADARIEREGIDRFSAWVPAGGDGELRWVFHREGLGWRLTNIVMPDGVLASGLP